MILAENRRKAVPVLVHGLMKGKMRLSGAALRLGRMGDTESRRSGKPNPTVKLRVLSSVLKLAIGYGSQLLDETRREADGKAY